MHFFCLYKFPFNVKTREEHKQRTLPEPLTHSAGAAQSCALGPPRHSTVVGGASPTLLPESTICLSCLYLDYTTAVVLKLHSASEPPD